MRKLFIPFLFLFTYDSDYLPSTKEVIYHSITNETIKLTLTNYQHCTSVINCGDFRDSVMLGCVFSDGNKNERVLTINTNSQDIYGWSDGKVTFSTK